MGVSDEGDWRSDIDDANNKLLVSTEKQRLIGDCLNKIPTSGEGEKVDVACSVHDAITILHIKGHKRHFWNSKRYFYQEVEAISKSITDQLKKDEKSYREKIAEYIKEWLRNTFPHELCLKFNRLIDDVVEGHVKEREDARKVALKQIGKLDALAQRMEELKI